MSGVIIKFKVRSHGAVECMGLYVYTCSCCQVLLNNTVKVHQRTCMYFKPWPLFTVYLNQNLNQYSLCCESFFLNFNSEHWPPLLFLYLQGNATLHLYPHFEPLRQIEGKICFIMDHYYNHVTQNFVSGLFFLSNHIAKGSRNLTSFIVIYLYLDIIY